MDPLTGDDVPSRFALDHEELDDEIRLKDYIVRPPLIQVREVPAVDTLRSSQHPACYAICYDESAVVCVHACVSLRNHAIRKTFH